MPQETKHPKKKKKEKRVPTFAKVLLSLICIFIVLPGLALLALIIASIFQGHEPTKTSDRCTILSSNIVIGEKKTIHLTTETRPEIPSNATNVKVSYIDHAYYSTSYEVPMDKWKFGTAECWDLYLIPSGDNTKFNESEKEIVDGVKVGSQYHFNIKASDDDPYQSLIKGATFIKKLTDTEMNKAKQDARDKEKSKPKNVEILNFSSTD